MKYSIKITTKAANHFAVLGGILWAVLLLFSGQVRADVLAGWETTGLSGFGPSPFAPNSTANPNLTIGGLTRGSGLTTGGSAGASAWGGVNFAGTDAASAVGGNDFATFTVTANPGYSVSFTDIPGYNVRRSNTGPKNGIWQYQVGSGDFTDIGSAITWGSNTGAPGNSQSAIDLSGISDLQNVPPGTTVTFRIVSWGGGAAGTWYINNMSGADLQIEGTVSAAAPSAPSASDATSILSSGFTANWSPSDGATGYRLDVSPVSDFSSFVPGYEDLDVANVTSYVVSGLSIGTTYYYRVRAYNDSGTSDNSSAIAVTTASSGIPAMTVMLPGQSSANSGTPDVQTAGGTFTITVTATTDGITTDTSYSGTQNITFSGPTGSPAYPATVNFSGGVGTADITLSAAETTAITATDGTITGIASSSLTVNPGAIASYTVTASPAQTVGAAFPVTVVAKDAYNNIVTTDSSTSVSLSSGSGNVSFDINPQTLTSGTFTVSATDNTIETTTITATDGNSVSGTSDSIVINSVPQYRSKQDGNWSDASTWESSPDGATWTDAITAPTAADNTITIRNTVTIAANVTVDEVVVASGGTLVMSSAFSVNDGLGDDIDVQDGGVFVLGVPATAPTFAEGSTAKIETGGTLRVNSSGLTANGTGANTGNFVYGDASVLEFNYNGSFSASGVTFFPNVDANTVPIFRNARASVSVGGGSPTVVNGIFEVAPGLTVTWTGAGLKTFRNGIRGDGNVTQGPTSGQFVINGATAELGGGGTVTLNANGLSIDPASVTTLSSDKTVDTSSGGIITVGGVLDLNGKTLAGDTTVTSGGTLKGSGTMAGIVTVSGGTVAPGSSIGAITFNNTPTLAGASVLEIDRTASPNADQIIVPGGTLNFGGTLEVVNIGSPLQSGDSFTLFAAGGFGGSTFDNVTLPSLDSGLSWDTSLLDTTGVVTVTGSGGGDTSSHLTIQRVGGSVQLAIIGGAGVSYQLQYSDTLSPANWQNLGDVFVMPLEGTNIITDVTAGTSRFYRAVTTSP